MDWDSGSADSLAMPDQPGGEVTLLFTDIEGSTRLLEELGSERYAEAVEEHRRIVRAAISRHRGYEVDAEGDAFFIAFPSAAGAAAAAAEAKAGLEHGPIGVRMGIHTGEPLVRHSKYVGLDVHVAARIMSTAHGGQIVLSERARASLDDLFAVRELGWYRLKDVAEPLSLYQLGGGEFPSLRALAHTDLPRQPTPFLGRDRELAGVLGALARDDVRMLTLTGPGGSGKTRLAVAAAERLARAYPYGVTFINLTSVRDAGLVVPTVGEALGAQENAAAAIGDRRLLLVLDNFEHVIAAAPELAALLAACENVDLLVTSREILRIAAEHEFPVPPLLAHEAVVLFSARARALVRDFEPDHATEEICRRLDRLPLALELAAAHIRTLSATEILLRLDQLLALSSRAPRDAPERHRTLRATIAWSYDLLKSNEKRLFAQLSVFAGGWTFDAAHEVGDADLDTLHALNDKSLIRQEHDRYTMLETIREYAAEELTRSGGAQATRSRHARYFLRLAEKHHPDQQVDQVPALRRLAPEHDNFRAALSGALEAGENELALQLATTLVRFWDVRAPAEGVDWLERSLASTPHAPQALRIDALCAAGEAAWFSGDPERAKAHFTVALDLARAADDQARVAMALTRLAPPLMSVGSEFDAARTALDQAAALNLELGQSAEYALTLSLLGYLAIVQEDWTQGRSSFEQALTIARDRGDSWLSWNILTNLASCEVHDGELERAAGHAREALELGFALEDADVIHAVALLCEVAAKRRRRVLAGVLWSAIERLEQDLESRFQWEEERARVQELLGQPDRAFTFGVACGYAMSIEEVLSRAYRLPGARPPTSSRGNAHSPPSQETLEEQESQTRPNDEQRSDERLARRGSQRVKVEHAGKAAVAANPVTRRQERSRVLFLPSVIPQISRGVAIADPRKADQLR